MRKLFIMVGNKGGQGAKAESSEWREITLRHFA